MGTEVYRDFYGNVAYLRVMRSGAARLTIYTPGGRLCHAKDYKTRRGARIAMGRLLESWERR